MKVLILFLLPLDSFATVAEWKGSRPSNRIVQGFDCMPESFPYLVSIQTIKYRHFCGGSLFSEKLVLTAAHCCDKTPNMYVFAGMSTLKRKIVQKARVNRVFQHPDYGLHPMKNDLCLMELRTPIFETDTIQFVKVATPELWEHQRLSDCRKALVLGFGYRGQKFLNGSRMYPNKIYQTNLQCVNLKLLQSNVCEFAIAEVDESIFCALDESVKGRDPCQGDSGGPFMCNDVQYGIVSSGFGCGLVGYPSLYARVDIHNGFMKSVYATNRGDDRNGVLTAKANFFSLTSGMQLFLVTFLVNL